MMHHVPTGATNKSGIVNNPIELPYDTIGKMIRRYKGRVSYGCRQPGYEFAWQARFHDHVIRDRRSLENIRQYIKNNLLQWNEDVFNATSIAYQQKFGPRVQKNSRLIG